MLKNPCDCKGSLSSVHEACLVKWLVQKNIRSCELCLAPFIVKEEFRSLNDISRQLFTYLIAKKRSLLKIVIYAVYLLLFVKRFAFVIKYGKNQLVKFLKGQLRMMTYESSIMQRSGPTSRDTFIRVILTTITRTLILLCNSIILVQLCCIGYAEWFRIRKVLN